MRFLLMLAAVFISWSAAAEQLWDFSKNLPANNHFINVWAKGIRERKVQDGALHAITKGHPAYFTPVQVNLPLEQASMLIVEMKAEKGADLVQVYANVSEPSQSFATQKLITDEKYHFYVFDFTQMPKVKAAKFLKNFRLNPDTSVKGAAFSIRSIRLTAPRINVPGVTAVIPKAPATLKVPNFFQLPHGGNAAAPSNLELSYTDDGILIKYETTINNVSYTARCKKRDEAVYNDDCFDITLKPAREYYYQVVFNPEKTIFDQRVTYTEFMTGSMQKNTPMGHGVLAWDSQAEIQSNIAPGRWYGSIFIPFKAIGMQSAPAELEMNIGRSSNADSKGVSAWNYSPVVRFALPENLRKVKFASSSSAAVTYSSSKDLLPGSNTAVFNNIDKRFLKCQVAVRDLANGQSKVFTASGKDDKITVTYELAESKYELLLTVFENDQMIFFDSFTVDNSLFRKRLAEVYQTVQSWSNEGTFASVKARLSAEGKNLIDTRSNDFNAIRKYIAEVEKVSVLFKQQELYLASVNSFKRSDLPFAVASASSADKIFRSLEAGVPSFKGSSAAALNIECAANEVEGTQLVLVNMNKAVEGLKVKVVKKPSGKAPVIKLYGVDFLDTRNVLPTKYKVIYRGEWPEVLAEDIFRKLAPGEVRSIWINAECSKDQPAGNYEYTLEISCKNLKQPLQVPLTVKVYDFALPVTPNLRTAVSSYDRYIPRYYEKFGKKFSNNEKLAMTDTLVRFMLKHRLNPGHIYTMRAYGQTLVDYPDLNRLAEYSKLGLNAVPVAQMPMSTFQDTAEMMMQKYYQPKQVENLIATLQKVTAIARQQNMEHTLYMHVFDEVFAATHKHAKMRELAKLAKRIKEVAPHAKLECITEVEKELIGVIDIWCPSIKMMTRNPQSYWDRQKAGDELWLYTCLGAPGHVTGEPPSFVLEESAAAMRLIGWICYFYRAEGFLYYSSNNWTRNGNPGEKPYPATPWNMQYVNSFNGEACLFYPNRHPERDPLSSIRLENLRDGMEDFEYLKMLADLSKKHAGKLSAAQKQEIADLLGMKELVRSGFDYTDDSGKIADQRRKMAQWIEKLNKF